jgi:hypothetical protein
MQKGSGKGLDRVGQPMIATVALRPSHTRYNPDQ